MRRTTILGAALALGAFLAVPARAQQQPGACPVQPMAPDSSVQHGDASGIPVVIIARVHADAVVFESDPDVRVRLNGCDPLPGQLHTTSNVPDSIVPGVRYTNVELTSEYRAWLTVECRAPADVAARLCEELTRRD